MKPIFFGILTAAALLLSACGSSKPLTVEQQQVVKTTLRDRDFKIDVSRAYPTNGRSVNLTSPYSLEVRGDSVISYLPYFGRAYSVPYGGGAGLNFKGLLTDYKVEQGRKGEQIVTFYATSPDDRLRYSVEVWPDGGTSSINVQPQNRQAIRFDGEIALAE